MNPCIICYGPCTGPRLPACGHVHCKLCFRRNTKASKLRCAWPECERSTPVEEARELQLYADPTIHERGTHVTQYDIEVAYCRQQWLAEKDTMAGEDEYVLTLFLLLTKLVRKCKDIRRFHENAEGNKLILHIKPGTREPVTAFLTKEKLAEENSVEQYFEFVEQTKAPKFLVATGAKVTTEALLQQRQLGAVIGTHPDKLQARDISATVTCVGVDRYNRMHLLTTRHMFGANTQEKGRGNFISCHQNKLSKVSTSFHGKIGTVLDEQEQGHLVDIAALPLEKDVQKSINPSLIHRLRSVFDYDPRESYTRLRKKTVYKHGATSGTTCGKIANALCYLNEEDTEGLEGPEGLVGSCLLITSADPTQSFAEAGDSGALIWDENGTTLGLVAMSDEQFTYAVRLDHCLQALGRLEEPVEIRLDQLKAVGSPIPVIQFPDTEMETREPPWTLEDEALLIV